MEQEEIRKELNELVATYYDGSFARLVQEYIRTSSMKEEERKGLMETMRSLNQQSLQFHLFPKDGTKSSTRWNFWNH